MIESALERLQIEAPNASAAVVLCKHHHSRQAMETGSQFRDISPIGPNMPRYGQKSDEEISRANSEALRGGVVGGAKVRISPKTSVCFRTISMS